MNIISVRQVSSQKHFGLTLDTTLTFNKHIKTITSKVSKTRSVRKLNNCVPQSPLTTIYKSLVWSRLDYGDVIFDKAYNNSFQ